MQLNIIKLESTDSTNNYAHNLIKNSEKSISELSGTVIWSLEQTMGRGQRTNKWESESGQNLTFSLIITPSTLPVAKQFLLSKIISLAVHDFLSKIFQDVTIKWPNDLYIGDKKIAGILIENSVKGSEIFSSVIGIGLNVNQLNFSAEIPNVTSMRMISNKTYNIEQILHLVLEQVFVRLMHFFEEKTDSSLDTEYLKKLFRYNEQAKFKVKNEIIEGIICGVNEYGFLRLKPVNLGPIMEYPFKEIEFIID